MVELYLMASRQKREELHRNLNNVRKQALPRHLENFSRAMNFQIHEDIANKRAEIPLYGFAVTNFDRAGNLGFYDILKSVELDRYIVRGAGAEQVPWLGVLNSTLSSAVSMVVAHEIHVARDLYNRAAFKFPMVYLMETGYASESSMSTCVSLLDGITRTKLVTSQRHLAFRDRNTGHRWSLPKDMKSKLLEFSTTTKKPVAPPPPRPKDIALTFVHQVTTRYSDMDIMFHVNQGMFVQFCMDCAAEASVTGFYKVFQGDIAWYHVKSARTLHRGEAVAGEVLRVVTWEGKDWTLFFEIERDGALLLQCTLEFHPPDLSSKSKL